MNFFANIIEISGDVTRRGKQISFVPISLAFSFSQGRFFY